MINVYFISNDNDFFMALVLDNDDNPVFLSNKCKNYNNNAPPIINITKGSDCNLYISK